MAEHTEFLPSSQGELSDMDEILALSDRIIVIYEGEIMGEVSAEKADPEQLGLLMAGVRTQAGE